MPTNTRFLTKQIAIINKVKDEPAETADEENYGLTKRRKFGDDQQNVEIIKIGDDVNNCRNSDITTRSRKTTAKNKGSVRFASQCANNKTAITNENSNVVRKEKFPALVTKHTKIANSTNHSHLPSLPTSSSSAWMTPRLEQQHRQQDTDQQKSWAKRKFYAVQTARQVAEVYCTDAIHRIKKAPSKYGIKENDDGTVLRIVDKWREEWNQGVQVPLGSEKDTYDFEATALFPDLPVPEPFELPKKLIAHYPTKYTKSNAKEFQMTVRQPLCSYLIDSIDRTWLKQEHQCGAKFSEQTFVEIMNSLEITAYQKIHEALLEPLNILKVNSEEDADCMICRLTESEIGDRIVFCDGCNISVHQSCYGIAVIPPDEWFCQLCEHFGQSVVYQPCLFCPVKGGPMKATKHMKSWAHVTCALWIPEVRFGNVETRGPITHVEEIPAEKWQARCCICDTRKGTCIKCAQPKCDATFHVGCAQRAEFVLNIVCDDKCDNGVRMVSLCDKHSTNSCYSGGRRKIRFNKVELFELHKEFAKFVNAQQIVTKLAVPFDVAERIYLYWIWKREQNNCNPLINEPEINVQRQEQQPAVLKSPKARRSVSKKKKRLAEPSIYGTLPEDVVRKNFEGIRSLRLRFEKARNLCYMVGKREKLKRTEIEVFEEQIRKIADQIFCERSIVPVSKRRMEKILAESKEIVEFRPLL